MTPKTVAEYLADYQQRMCRFAAELCAQPRHPLDRKASAACDTSFLLVSSLFLETGKANHHPRDYIESTARLLEHASSPLTLFVSQQLSDELVEKMRGTVMTHPRKIYIIDPFTLPILSLFGGRDALREVLGPGLLKLYSVMVYARHV